MYGYNICHIIILWHVCWKPELWSQQRQPLLGNGSINIIARQQLARHMTAGYCGNRRNTQQWRHYWRQWFLCSPCCRYIRRADWSFKLVSEWPVTLPVDCYLDMVGGRMPHRCEEGRPKAVRDKVAGNGQQQYYWTEAVQVTNTDDRPDLSSEGAPDIDKAVHVKQKLISGARYQDGLIDWSSVVTWLWPVAREFESVS
jgi:hypothetical protein